MSLFKGRLGTKIVDITNNSYELDGMIGPTFYNIGETTVKINQLDVLPGESYPVELPNMVNVGTINIQFLDEPGKRNLVLINYAVYMGPFVEPYVSDAQRMAALGNC